MSAYFVPHLLQNRRYLVTGATGGAGSAVAIEISRVGGKVTIMGRDGDKVEKLRRELHGSGHMSWTLTDEAPQFEGAGPFDGIFHAAGAEVIVPLLSQTDTHFAKAFGPSVEMLANMMRDVGKRKDGLVKDGGSIVVMSSVAAVRGTTGMSLYSASKGAVEAMTRSAAVELAARRIRVNCIRAGAFASPMHARICQRSTPEAIDEYARRHLFGFGKAEDIAHAVIYLLSDASRWVTGTSMTIDGGLSAK